MNIRIKDCEVRFIKTPLRLPLKFGAETIDALTCSQVRMTVTDEQGNTASGWGETPLSAAWAWPSTELSYTEREQSMINCCRELAVKWSKVDSAGHPMELGYDFSEQMESDIPHLAVLICNSAFDIALHDAYGRLLGISTFSTYNERYMNRDLNAYFGEEVFIGKYPEDFFIVPQQNLPVWHLIGGKDLLNDAEANGSEPCDGYPVTLTEWIRRDGLKCLKIKLTGSDPEWDYNRILKVGEIALQNGCHYLSPDFNCLVKSPDYVNAILDRLMIEYPAIFGMILYVEQPFPYELKQNRIDVHSVSARKPLFMDESAHDWRHVKLGFELGWTGVALKTCKTLTGALLSGCWAKSHGMTLMVQDLTNPMLAMIPHVQLARYIGTIMGVECNAPQFYPEVSRDYEARHPKLYRRYDGTIDLSTLSMVGLGYLNEDLPCTK
ncbi:MAG: hypothetical protein PHI56_06105 [Victivallaceae bacterium]|jgi:L-alanine-DL-glutamate epimerase-like enolase superfamily enzyme|nr:hypothetical protein [Victivallaceae bacterium]MDD3116843.1 hypothetical protein [Victivallaceae bacterium]